MSILARFTRIQASRCISATLLGVALILQGIAAPAAEAIEPGFGCMAANGLMNEQDPDDLLDGRVVLTTGAVVDLGVGDVDWGRTSLDDGSARLLYSLKWVESLVREYDRSGSDVYRARALEYVLDFVADNPVGGGPDPVDAWYPMYAGQRATTLACVLEMSGDARVAEALADHGAWLADLVGDLDAWNQSIDPNLGLLAAGCDLGISSWRDTAAVQFDRLVVAMIDAEGVLTEQAPGYGRFVWDRWGAVGDKLRQCGLDPSTSVTSRRAALLEWLAWASGPDGRLAPLGDTYASTVPPTPAGAPTVWTASGGTSGSAPASDRVRVFNSGWVFGRSSWDPFQSSSYWSLRFGPPRDLHGHEDHQSVTLWVDGLEVLVDSGHAGYRDAAYREALRGPTSHNVLMLPGVDFRIRQATSLSRTGSGDGWYFHEVTDDAFGIQNRKIVDAPRTRGVLMLPEHGAMVVQDRASRVDAGLFEQLWHLVPGARVVSQTRSTVVARHPSGKADIHVVQVPLPGQELPRGAMTVVSGATDPYLGWYSDGPDKRVAAPVVRARRYGTQARMVTVVAATPVGGSVGASVVESVGGVQLRLAIGGRVADVGLSRYGDMRLGAAAIGSVAPPAGATVLHGDWNGDGADERGWFHEGTFGLDPGDGGDTFVIDYGLPGDKPVVGDWDGDGVDTVGIVRGNLWVLRSEYKRGADDVVMRYGEPTDDPVVGDWDGDGVDTLGVRRGNLWVLRSEYKRGADDVVMRYGEPTDTPVVGDYDGDGDDTLGIRRGRLWVLRDEYRRNAEDRVFTW